MTFGTNLLLAILWAALIGPFEPSNLLIGFGVGYAVLWICTSRRNSSGYVRRVAGILSLSLYTIIVLVIANFRVAWYTISPLKDLRPAILEVPIEPDATDTEITLLATLITLTPGTLTLDVAQDRHAIYVHFMHVDDVDKAVEEIKTGFEKRIMEATR